MSSTEEAQKADVTEADADTSTTQSEMSDIDRIKAAHAARRARRSRPPRPPSSSILPPEEVTDDQQTSKTATTTETTTPSNDQQSEDTSDSNNQVEENKEDDKVKQLEKEVSDLKLELSSLRRNHLQNIKRITEQRDMFAEQLSKEQQQQNLTSKSKSNSNNNNNNNNNSKNDIEVQLRAARIRNSDLESENTILRDENKQLNFRVQASKTLDAASNGYQLVVNELVDTKLKYAQVLEEKEDLIRINKELTTTSQVLTNANGELEKSRSQWVLQCAQVEKKRTELENLLKQKNIQHPSLSNKTDNNSNSSFSTVDLQELKL